MTVGKLALTFAIASIFSSPLATYALDIEFDRCAAFRSGYNAQGQWSDSSRAYRECREHYNPKPAQTYHCSNVTTKQGYDLQVKNENGAYLVRESESAPWQESPFAVQAKAGQSKKLNLDVFDRKGRLKTHSKCELAN